MPPVSSVLRAAMPIALVTAFLTVPATAASAAVPCPWVGSRAPIDKRVAQVVTRMTLDEKIAMVHGTGGSAYTGFVPGDARSCVPALKLQDGPVGVRMNDTTQLPSAADLAASFDPGLARRYGAVIGAEDKTKGGRRRPRADHQYRARSAVGPRVRVLQRGSPRGITAGPRPGRRA